MTATIHTFWPEQDLTYQLSRHIRQALEQAISDRGHAYLVVSGGRTPIPLFNNLAQQILPWKQVTILLADERWLPADHEASNERLVKQHLLRDRAATAQFISLLSPEDSPTEACAKINQRLANIPTFDVVLLGLGEDGHTASLFPDSPELAHGMTTSESVVAMTPQNAPYQRISLSRTRLLKSRQIYFHLVGEAKAKTLATVMDPKSTLPATQFLLQEDVPVSVMLAVPKE